MIDLVRLASFVLQIEVSSCDRLLHYRVRQRERADEEAAAKITPPPDHPPPAPLSHSQTIWGPPIATLQPTHTV